MGGLAQLNQSTSKSDKPVQTQPNQTAKNHRTDPRSLPSLLSLLAATDVAVMAANYCCGCISCLLSWLLPFLPQILQSLPVSLPSRITDAMPLSLPFMRAAAVDAVLQAWSMYRNN